jgi:hypothetical protein
MDSKTQTYYIYALAIVALILLYKVFNWNTYKCRLCAKVNIPGICRDCEAKEGFRFRRNRRLRRRQEVGNTVDSIKNACGHPLDSIRNEARNRAAALCHKGDDQFCLRECGL